jgi:hypothetical protein
MVDKQYHVAWADRIGLTDRWRRDLDLCSETFGTKYYPARVDALRNDIININDGPQLSDMIDEYVNNFLRNWIETTYSNWRTKYPHDAKIREGRLKTEKEISFEAKKRLNKYITQLLEDNGFGTYKTRVIEDEISLNSNNIEDSNIEEET